MPTITPANTTAPVSTVQPTQPANDSRRAAAIAAIEGGQQNSTPSRIDDVAPGSTLKGTPAPQGTPPDGQEPISPLNANPPKDQADIERRLNQMAQKERAAWEAVKQAKAEKTALQKAQEGRLTKEEWAEQFRKDPTSVGLPYEEVGSVYLNQGTPAELQMKQMAETIKDLQAKVVASEDSMKTAQQQAYEQALQQIDSEVRSLVSSNDAYEVTRSHGAEGAVSKFIELTYQEEGILMNVKEAAAQVESYLEQEALSLFNKSTKLKAKLAPVAGTSPNATPQMKTPNNPQTQRQTTTLTHALTQASSKPMSRRDRAILIAQGKNPDAVGK